MHRFKTCGISVLNPVDIEQDYLDFTVDYAIQNKYNHVQLIGPIHNPVKGNIDGMTYYKKYACFNDEKDSAYVDYNLDVVNKALKKLHDAGIKSYMWHHELELPLTFSDAFPEVLNSDGDIEVSHPLVTDFLQNKIKDFFDAYPYMDGIILTLHETRVPLLKLKNQKLSKGERVKLVTKVLYDTCVSLGKKLICRPFASIEEDYEMMTRAYEEISTDMVIMDKWTQFDWSLTLPDNAFFAKIKNNPILVETDIFGEYFGKGCFPLMLKEHIEHKIEYCAKFSPDGFCSRIDRAGRHPFGDVNEVNLYIMNACTKGEDVDKAIDDFFESKYPGYGDKVREIMENTEEILRRIIYLKGYYFSELSLFPQLNHSKNHFYFEMMREDYALCSGEWFIPKNWLRGSIEGVIAEKQSAVDMANKVYDKLQLLKGKLDDKEFEKLNVKFLNLKICASVWRVLVDVFYNYAKYFELKDEKYEKDFYLAINKLDELNEQGKALLGANFYCVQGDAVLVNKAKEFITSFTSQTVESFKVEKETTLAIEKEKPYDFVVCGGGNEHHKIKKEVNFSDTLILDGKLARVPGSTRKGWSSVNAHGWFSYEIAVKPNSENVIQVQMGSETKKLDVKVTVNDQETIIKKDIDGVETVTLKFTAGAENNVRVRFDRLTSYTPCIFTIKVFN